MSKALRTREEIFEAGRKAGRKLGPLNQEAADLVAAILAPHADLLAQIREQQGKADAA